MKGLQDKVDELEEKIEETEKKVEEAEDGSAIEHGWEVVCREYEQYRQDILDGVFGEVE